MKFIRLNHIGFYRVSGKDSRRYLNSRLTADIKNLAVGQSCLAAALNPQGRTEGFFRVNCVTDDSFLLASDVESEVLEAAIKRYIVADRVTVVNASAEFVCIHFDSELPAANFPSEIEIKPTLSRRTGSNSFDIYLAQQDLERFSSLIKSNGWQSLSQEEFEFKRISQGLPSFPQEINSDSLFFESGIKSAISFKKGCYVGQEVVERVDSHGRVARKLQRLSFSKQDFNLTSAEEVSLVSQEQASIAGKVISVSQSETTGATAAFVLVKNIAAGLPSSVMLNGAEVSLRPIE